MSALVGLAFGPFELTRLIGRGGMAEVFLAQRRDLAGSPEVVLKRLRPEVAADVEYSRRLALEAQLASRLSHPSIVKLLEYGRVGDCYYLAMEQVKGWSLRRLVELSMERDQPPPLGAALGIIEGILGGLSTMHAAKSDDGKPRPFLHRDVTPNNVIVDHTGRAVLIDYGIAKDVYGPSITVVGKVVGTSRYMAPEHRLSQRCTPRADVFSASRICFELITARPPWPLLSAHRELLRVVFDPPEVTPEIEGRLPEDIRAIVWRGLACNADERFLNATEMLEALQASPTWADYGQDASAQVLAWIKKLEILPDEGLLGPVIDSAPARSGSGITWSPSGQLSQDEPDVATSVRISQLPQASVLSIPPLPPPKKRDSIGPPSLPAPAPARTPTWILGAVGVLAAAVVFAALALSK